MSDKRTHLVLAVYSLRLHPLSDVYELFPRVMSAGLTNAENLAADVARVKRHISKYKRGFVLVLPLCMVGGELAEKKLHSLAMSAGRRAKLFRSAWPG